jgi:hypothetical protein
MEVRVARSRVELRALFQRDGVVPVFVGQLGFLLARDGRFIGVAVLAPHGASAVEVVRA